MGYYINTEEVRFFLPKSNFDEAYKRMCSLNDMDHLKQGGSFGGNDDARSDRPQGDRKSTRLNSSHVSESRMPSSA